MVRGEAWARPPADRAAPYSIFARGVERDVLPALQRYDMGAIVWSPLNGGWLTGKYRSGEQAPEGSRFERLGRGPWSLQSAGAARKFAAVERLEGIASAASLDLITMALAFTLAHPAVSSAIIGPRTDDQLTSQLKAADVVLMDDVLDAIDGVVAPGETIDQQDISYEPQAVRKAHLRRR